MKKSVRKFLTGLGTDEAVALLQSVATANTSVAAVTTAKSPKSKEVDSDNYNSGNEDTDTAVDNGDSAHQYTEDEDEDVEDVVEDNASDDSADDVDEEDVDDLDDADDTEHIQLDSTASYSPRDLKRLKQVARTCIARNEHIQSAKQLLRAIAAYKHNTAVIE
jgi:uncharacterized protein YcbK (DUF882 family)